MIWLYLVGMLTAVGVGVVATAGAYIEWHAGLYDAAALWAIAATVSTVSIYVIYRMYRVERVFQGVGK